MVDLTMKKINFRRVTECLLVVAGAFLLAGCDGAGSSGTTEAVSAANVQRATDEPQPAIESVRTPAVQPTGRGPMIIFAEKVHDLGTIWDVEDQEFEFRFTNTGDSTLIIDEVKASCGCTTPGLDKNDYAPGESGRITIKFDPKGRGDQSKYLTVASNAVNEPSVKIFIKSFIKEFVSLEPHIVQFKDVKRGQPHTRIVQLTSVDPNIEVTQVISRNAYMRARVVGGEVGPVPQNSSQQGGPRAIEVSLLENIPWGQTFGSVDVMTRGRITADSATIDHKMIITVNVVAFDDVIVGPLPLSIGVVPAGGILNKPVTLRSRSGAPFQILSTEFVSCPFDGLRADILPLDDAQGFGYTINISGPTGGYQGPMRGSLRVITDLPGEPTINIPILGRIGELPK